MWNPKIKFIKNLNTCCTTIYHKQQSCEVSDHSNANCKRDGIHKLSYMKKCLSPCFAMGNPKINFIKNLNTCCTTTYHMQQSCEVSDHSNVNCKRNGVHKLSYMKKCLSPCFAMGNPKINFIKNLNTCCTTTYHMQ